MSAGQFPFKSLEPGTEIVLERNPDYRWAPESARHQGRAWLEQITFKNVPEEATRVAVLRRADRSAPSTWFHRRTSRDSSSDDYVVDGELLNHNYSLYLNVLREPWTDSKIRQALKLSLLSTPQSASLSRNVGQGLVASCRRSGLRPRRSRKLLASGSRGSRAVSSTTWAGRSADRCVKAASGSASSF